TPGPGLAAVGTQQVNVNGTNNTLTVYGKVSNQKESNKSNSTKKSSDKNKNSSSGGGSMANAGGSGSSTWNPSNREALEAWTRAAEYSKRVADASQPKYHYDGYPSFDNGTRAATNFGYDSNQSTLRMADAFSDHAKQQAAEWTAVSSSALNRAQFEPPKADISTKSLAKDIKALNKAIA
ncbi:MAG: hypothetical protein VKJ63_06875, partial [Synechococcus sp.]|nr:hypothetical protein [Synechococcus sp.]